MPERFKINSLIITTLAGMFYLFFMLSKHDPVLAAVNAFGEDPFDAIGSFGVQAAALLSLLSLIRAFRPRQTEVGEEQKVFLLGTQICAVLAVAVTLVGDLVAMARYPRVWISSPAGYRLAGLLGGMAILTLAAAAPVLRLVEEVRFEKTPNLWKRAAAVCLAGVIALGFYPDHLRQSTFGAICTVLVGAILLFAPIWAVGTALMSDHTGGKHQDTVQASRRWHLGKNMGGMVIFLGILLGLVILLSEFSLEKPGLNLGKLAFVAMIYIGLETCGLLIGYIFLKKLLGFIY